MTQMNEGMLSRTKIFAHPDRLAQWLATASTYPVTAQLDPTNRCNYDCNQCAGLRIARSASLDGEQMTRIIDQLAPHILGLEVTGGGEPLLNQDTPPAIAYARQKGIDVALITHGQLFTERIASTIIDSCTYVRFSVDASTNEAHSLRKGTRSERSLDSVLRNIRHAVEAKSRSGSSCTIGMSYLTDHEDTLETMRAFATLARDCGVDYAQFRPYHHSVRDFRSDIKALSAELDTSAFHLTHSDDRYERQRFDYTQQFSDEFRTVIAATGDMYPDCFTRGIANFSFGNLLRDDFAAIWNSQRRRTVEATKLEQANCPSACHYDPLSQLLWDMRKQTQDVAHENFV